MNSRFFKGRLSFFVINLLCLHILCLSHLFELHWFTSPSCSCGLTITQPNLAASVLVAHIKALSVRRGASSSLTHYRILTRHQHCVEKYPTIAELPAVL